MKLVKTTIVSHNFSASNASELTTCIDVPFDRITHVKVKWCLYKAGADLTNPVMVQFDCLSWDTIAFAFFNGSQVFDTTHLTEDKRVNMWRKFNFIELDATTNTYKPIVLNGHLTMCFEWYSEL